MEILELSNVGIAFVVGILVCVLLIIAIIAITSAVIRKHSNEELQDMGVFLDE